MYIFNLKKLLNEHWTALTLSPSFFYVEILYHKECIPIYLYSDHMLTLYLQLQLGYKNIWFFSCGGHFRSRLFYFKKWMSLSWLLNLVSPTIILVWRKIQKFLCTVLWREAKYDDNWTLYTLCHFDLEKKLLEQWHEKQISLIPTLGMLNKNWQFLHPLKGIFKFSLMYLWICSHCLPDIWNVLEKKMSKYFPVPL